MKFLFVSLFFTLVVPTYALGSAPIVRDSSGKFSVPFSFNAIKCDTFVDYVSFGKITIQTNPLAVVSEAQQSAVFESTQIPHFAECVGEANEVAEKTQFQLFCEASVGNRKSSRELTFELAGANGALIDIRVGVVNHGTRWVLKNCDRF